MNEQEREGSVLPISDSNREVLEFQVNDSENRLDIFISERIDRFNRSYLKKLIKEEKVLVNNKASKPSYKVKKGDLIQVTLDPPKEIDARPQDIPISILYEDKDILIVNKEQGMVVHPAPGSEDNTLVNALLYHTKDLSGINGELRPGIVHRIDKDTSGILVVAKNDLSHQFLSKQLEDHSMNREYLALVKGIVPEDSGTINKPIGRDPNNRTRRAITTINSKEAVTHYSVLKRFKEGYTLCRFKLETGRTHQIRVHMKSLGFPIAGDPVYGGSKNPFKTEGQLLHAYILGFIHPYTKQYVEFRSELPDYFKRILENLTPIE